MPAVRLNAADMTGLSWLRRTRGSPLPSAFHTRTVPSCEAETMRRPSGLNATGPDPVAVTARDEQLAATIGAPHQLHGGVGALGAALG